MIRINLLPYREEKKKAGIHRQILIVSIAFALFFFVIGSVHMHMVMDINSLEKQVKNSEARLKKLTKITGDVEKFKKDKAIVEKKLNIISDLEKNRLYPVHILDEVARKIPSGKIWLTSISQKGKDVRLGGIALSNSVIALYMTNLETSKYIISVDLISSKQVSLSNKKLMNFTLSCILSRG